MVGFGFTPPAQQSAPPPAPAGPAGAPPPPGPVTAASLPDMHAHVNGAVQMVPGAQLATMPPTTQVHHNGAWVALSTIPGYAPAGAPPPAPTQSAAPAWGAPPPTPAAVVQGWGNQPAQPAAAPTWGAPAQQGWGGQPQQQGDWGGQQSGPSAADFGGIESAQVYQKNANITDGKYIVRVEEAVWKANTRKGTKMGIFEVEILVSSYNPQDPRAASSNQVGSKASIYVMKNESFNSNMKEIVLALSGFDQAGQPRPQEDVVTPAECMAVFGPTQPAAGALCYIETQTIKTRQGNDYTKTNWWPCKADANGQPDLSSIPR